MDIDRHDARRRGTKRVERSSSINSARETRYRWVRSGDSSRQSNRLNSIYRSQRRGGEEGRRWIDAGQVDGAPPRRGLSRECGISRGLRLERGWE